MSYEWTEGACYPELSEDFTEPEEPPEPEPPEPDPRGIAEPHLDHN